MGKVERSLYVFGLYLIIGVGVGFIIMPTVVLDSFSLRYGDDTWIRFVGLLASVIGVYYIVAARAKLLPLYIWTVYMRLCGATFMIVMYLTGKVGEAVLLFAVVDAAGAAWTYVALRVTESARAAAHDTMNSPEHEHRA